VIGFENSTHYRNVPAYFSIHIHCPLSLINVLGWNCRNRTLMCSAEHVSIRLILCTCLFWLFFEHWYMFWIFKACAMMYESYVAFGWHLFRKKENLHSCAKTFWAMQWNHNLRNSHFMSSHIWGTVFIVLTEALYT